MKCKNCLKELKENEGLVYTKGPYTSCFCDKKCQSLFFEELMYLKSIEVL